MEYVSARTLASGPVLSEDETQALIRRLRAGDLSVKESLLRGHSRLVYSLVARFLRSGQDPEDLFQIGCIGLLKAIERFDPTFEVRFSTYAVPLIIGEIRRFLRDDGPIKISRSLKELAGKANRIREALRSQLGREPRLSEMAAALDVSEDELVAALDATRSPSSLEETVFQDEGNPVYLVDRITTDESEEDNLVEGLALRQIIGTLTPREQRIMEGRYFENKTQAQLAEEIGVSQVQISRLEKSILLRLRQLLLDSH